MGTNDRMPDKQQRTARRRRGGPKEVMYWRAEDMPAVAELLERISQSGGYLGFGGTQNNEALLLYVKLDDWRERIAIESYEALSETIQDLLAEL